MTSETNAEKYLLNFMDFFIESYRLRFPDDELALVMFVFFTGKHLRKPLYWFDAE